MIARLSYFLFLISVIHFHTASGAAEEASDELSLTAMTFNVLCSFCDRKNYDPWEERLDYFRDIIVRHEPDLIGLQELSKADEVDDFARTNPEYDFIYYLDEGADKPRPYPDATIMYRRDKFEPLESGNYWLSDAPDEPWSKGWARVQFWRLVTWARFKVKADGSELYFATTHFDNNTPNQEMSAPLLLKQTEPWAAKMPCIIVGDFNSKPASKAYGILTGAEGFKLTNTFDLADKWEVVATQSPKPEYDPASCIDHIFVAGPAEFDASIWRVDMQVYGEQSRPPSDHEAISAQITIRRKPQ